MNLHEPDIQSLHQLLNAFLETIREEIQSQSQNIKSGFIDQDTLEVFLLDLNTHYYQSFHERFYPLYKSETENEMRNFYRINRDETALKSDIVNHLKRMAQIYNGIKSTAKVLKTSRDSVQNMMEYTNRGQEQRIVELLYHLKDLNSNLLSFFNMLGKWQEFLEDQDLRNSLAVYPFHLTLHSLLKNWEPDSSRFLRDFKRFMIDLQLAVQLLLKLQYSDDPCQTARATVLEELILLDQNLAAKKTSPVLSNWYKQYIQGQLLLYIDLLALYAEKNERKRCLQTAQKFAEWVQALLTLLEKAMLSPNELGQLFLDLQSLSLLPADLKEMRELTQKTSQSLQDLIKELTGSAKPGFEHFNQAAKRIIADVYPQFKASLEQGKIPAGTVLYNGLSRISMQTAMLDMNLDLLNDKEEHHGKIMRQYHSMLNNMDTYQGLLTEAKNDLAKALAPRNLNRSFKDMDLRVEHIQINQGDVFPAQYLYLLDSANIIRENDSIVQEEDGDIFIINLDEFREELIPHIVLERKG